MTLLGTSYRANFPLREYTVHNKRLEVGKLFTDATHVANYVLIINNISVHLCNSKVQGMCKFAFRKSMFGDFRGVEKKYKSCLQ